MRIFMFPCRGDIPLESHTHNEEPMKKTALFIPCAVNLLLPQVARATDLVLQRLGVATVYPGGQTCCGQMVYNKGFFDQAKSFARHFIRVFENHDAIVCPSGSCTAMVKHHYPVLFDDEPDMKNRAEQVAGKIFEFSQYIVDVLKTENTGACFDGKVAYHESCHLNRSLGVSAQPKALIRASEKTSLVPMNQSDQCCGFGGEFSIAYPEISGAMVQGKVKNYLESGADILVLGEPGCLLNIGTYLSRNHPEKKAMHIAEFLLGPGERHGR